MLNIGDTFPNFVAESTLGKLDLYDYLASSWGVIFSHPKDFTPVCTTELGRLAVLQEEFEKRDVKVLGLSVDTVQDHVQWTQDIAAYAKVPVRFPLMADPTGAIARSLGILDKEAQDSLTVRAVFVISPDRRIKAVISYPSSCGRNFAEILRLVDSLQHTQQNPQFVTPVEWQKGDEVIVKPGLESAVVGTRVINLPSGKDYMKFTR